MQKTRFFNNGDTSFALTPIKKNAQGCQVGITRICDLYYYAVGVKNTKNIGWTPKHTSWGYWRTINVVQFVKFDRCSMSSFIENNEARRF